MLLRVPGRDRQGRKRKSSLLFHSHSASINSSFYAHFSLPGMPFIPWISLSPCRNSSIFLSGSEGKGALPRKTCMFLSSRCSLSRMLPCSRVSFSAGIHCVLICVTAPSQTPPVCRLISPTAGSVAKAVRISPCKGEGLRTLERDNLAQSYLTGRSGASYLIHPVASHL